MTESAPPDPFRILVVDDEEGIRTAVSRYLTHVGYEVEAAEDAAVALGKLKERRFHVMLLDIRMPRTSGIDFLPDALSEDPDLAVLMLSGLTDATTAATCMQRGAMDYLTKPIEMIDLRKCVESALRRRDTMIQQQELSVWVKEELAIRTRELEREHRRLEKITIATLEALINALEAKDDYFVGHSVRVSSLAATVASELGMSDDEIEMVRTAGRLHDIGQIGVRESVLHKKDVLSTEEHDHVKRHVTIGGNILAPLSHLGPVAHWIRHHHEHWDGSGYPDGLNGAEIPQASRILCACEVYDALTTPRPYQEPLPPLAATERMREIAEQVLDPEVVEAIAQAVSKRKTLTFVVDEEMFVE